jgi:hypothetical protein
MGMSTVKPGGKIPLRSIASMIIEIPTYADFVQASAAALNLAWDIAVALTKRFQFAIDEQEFDQQEITDQYWDRAQQQLGNAIALVQQGFELGLKAKIADISPFLLVANSTTDLPRNAPSGVPFTEFRTIDAKDLIRVNDLFGSSVLPEAFRDIFENNRRLRNQFIHGVVKGHRVTERQIYTDSLMGFKLLGVFAKSWTKTRIDYLSSQTSDSAVDTENLGWGTVITEMDSLIKVLTRKDLLDGLGFEKKARRYICPGPCYEEMISGGFRSYLNSELVALAQLTPNAPEATQVRCFVCETTSSVIRRNCNICKKSNVISNATIDGPDYYVCLVCGNDEQSKNA